MSDPRSGVTLGRYHLTEPLGGGPTGEVFRAKVYGVAGFERQFAIKRFHAALVADPLAGERVAGAARAYATLEHPRIARMHEYGVSGGTTFVAVELVPGIDLAKLVAATYGKGEPQPPGAVLSVVVQLARAVGYAHERGVLHLGLCPTNAIVTPDGDIKLTDFGFLRARLPEHPAEDATLAARLPYLAPEQLTGADPGPQTDVFQLAALAYELFTGERAFSGKGAVELTAQILAGTPPDPPLPAGLVQVLRRGMSAVPGDRHRDALAFADALDAAVRQAPLPGGRNDVAAAVRRAVADAAAAQAAQISGAVSFPLPAPPPSLPGVTMAQLLQQSRSQPPPALPGGPVSAKTIMGRASAVPEGNDWREESRGQSQAPARPERPPSRDQRDPDPPTVPGRSPAMVFEAPTRPVFSPASPVGGLMTPPPGAFDTPPPKSFDTPLPGTPVLEIEQLNEMDLHEVDLQDAEVNEADLQVADVTDEPEPSAPPSLPPLLAAGSAIPLQPSLRPHGQPPALEEAGTPLPVPLPLAAMPSGPIQIQAAPGPFPRFDPTNPVMPFPPPQYPPQPTYQPPPRRGVRPLLVVGIILAGLGIGGFFGYRVWLSRQAKPQVATKTPPTKATTLAPAPAPTPTPTPTPAPTPTPTPTPATAPATATATKTVPAPAPQPVEAPQPVPADGKLRIETTPSGAMVYLDGALKGKTPLELPATGDRHKLALVLAGHKLHRAEIDGSSPITVNLPESPKLTGPAGIKVKCKSKNRFYVLVDGNDTGELCSTERINVELGEHTVEVFDPVTDATTTHKVVVKDTHSSVRVKIDE